MRYARFAVLIGSLLLMISSVSFAAQGGPLVRIKDMADVEGVRSNQLVGVGLVLGLQGTGDKATMSLQMVRNRIGGTRSASDRSDTVMCFVPSVKSLAAQ